MIERMTIQQQKAQDEKELQRLKGQTSRSRTKLKKVQADLEAAQAKLHELELVHQEALREFAERGYRDITEIAKKIYELDGEYPYLCSLLSPECRPLSLKDAKQRQEALDEARTRYPIGTPPYPHDIPLWQVIGNFEEVL